MASNPHLGSSPASMTCGEVGILIATPMAERTRDLLVSDLAEVFVQFRQVEIHRRASPPKARPVSSAAPGVPAGAMAVRRRGLCGPEF